jgi:glyoxylase-like metal-dependent hydrolase (beta-lactamase superfamily II)
MPELITGACITIAPGVHRVLAPNPSFMTGPGTNTYIIGEQELTVLDPGPANDGHVEAILAAARQIGGSIRHILLTHTHKDHSPASAALVAHTGARITGLKPFAGDLAQDFSAAISHQPAHDELIILEGRRLRALHTPGHVGNHVCYWLEDERLLFTGDHLINGSTVVIIPPSGDMGDYIRSLQLLLDYPIARIAPGHGDIIDNAEALIRYTIGHRLAREQKVLEKLTALVEADLPTLVVPVYDDVNPALHPLAQYSLLAHLLKLQADAKVNEAGGIWRLAAT